MSTKSNLHGEITRVGTMTVGGEEVTGCLIRMTVEELKGTPLIYRAVTVTADDLAAKDAALEAARVALESCREAMVTLAALAGSEMNQGIPWAKLDEQARKALALLGGAR